MKTKFRIIAALILMLSFAVVYNVDKLTKKTDSVAPFALISVTKSGTHLATHLLTQLTGYPANNHGLQKLANQKQFSWYHPNLPPHVYNKLFVKNKKIKKILLVRDLRDVLVSYSNMIQQSGPVQGDITEQEREEVLGLPNDAEKLKWILNHEYQYQTADLWGFYLPNQCKTMSKALKEKNVLLVKFENLVGSKGGGSDELQFQEVKKIAQFINAPVHTDDERLKEIATSLFGQNSKTFSKGQIGSWEDFFDEEVTQLFNKKLLSYQKEFDYE